jgi:hypothetical protein
MKYTKEAVEVITNQVVEFARSKDGLYTKHSVVAGIDGTPIIYLMREDGNIDNAWVNELDQVCVESFGAGNAFKQAIADLWLPLETKAERIFRKKGLENDKLIASAIEQKGLIKDLHNNGRSHTQLTHVAKFGKPGQRERVVAIMGNTIFCLNELCLSEEGDAQLSTYSCGGNLDTRTQSARAAASRYSDMSGNVLWDMVRVDGKEDELEIPQLTVNELRRLMTNLPGSFDNVPVGALLGNNELVAFFGTKPLTDDNGDVTGFAFLTQQ